MAGTGAVLTDFGVARAIEQDEPVNHTRKGTLVGTPEYMAPEQLRGAGPSIRSDLYSFGLVLYEMVTGAHPFQRTRSTAVPLDDWSNHRAPSATLHPISIQSGATSCIERWIQTRAIDSALSAN